MTQIDLPMANWELRIREFDALLRPVANRSVDITQPGWFKSLQLSTPPLDEARVRNGVEALLRELLVADVNGSEHTRAAIREFFVQYHAFTWAATLSERPLTTGAFRRHLILFSIKDQGCDSRDALLTLGEICHEARTAGIDPEPLLQDIAGISSTINRFGMGSTRQMLLRHCVAVRR